MAFGFVRVAAVTPELSVADTAFNAEKIICAINEAATAGASIIVLPELAITGYTCGDLFGQDVLLSGAKSALLKIAGQTADKDVLVFVGVPWRMDAKTYNCMAAVCNGRILGLVPKQYLPNYSEFYEKRNFEPWRGGIREAEYKDAHGTRHVIPMGADIVFVCDELPELAVAAEICEDLWAAAPPSIAHALAGASVIVNGSASNECIGKDSYRRNLVSGQSGRIICGYVYASAGRDESTTDLVFGGHNIIAQNGRVLAEAPRFENGITYATLDVGMLCAERARNTTFAPVNPTGHTRVGFSLKGIVGTKPPVVERSPFVPSANADRKKRCEEILSIQSLGLCKRLSKIGAKNAVVGISGGLDSTLALLVTARAFDMLGYDRTGIWAITMPCFGTTGRTYKNACAMAQATGATLKEIRIEEGIRRHFEDIGHDESVHDTTYENAQARERTQVLMDFANSVNGIVIGTGDMSELALGWATYNGDHMSMYGVNAGVPKTLVRFLVEYSAQTCGNKKLAEALYDVLDTPISPELLPPDDSKIAQITEDLVGPYELHDFYLYYMLRFGFEPAKIYALALGAFAQSYDPATILKWLRTFYRRFFAQQYKRSCLPDGPKVGSVALSPRGDWRMPSDASAGIWLAQLDNLTTDV